MSEHFSRVNLLRVIGRWIEPLLRDVEFLDPKSNPTKLKHVSLFYLDMFKYSFLKICPILNRCPIRHFSRLNILKADHFPGLLKMIEVGV